MKVSRLRSRLSAFALAASFALWGCSSTQQQAEEEELATDGEYGEYEEDAEGNEELAEGNEEGGEGYEYGYDNAAGDETADAYSNEELGNEEGEQYANLENGNEGIQELINNAGQGAQYVENANTQAIEPATVNEAGNYQDPALAEQNVATAERAYTQPAMAASLPELGSKMPYVVQKGDTLAKVASKVYGNPARWAEIAELSSLANPSRIYPGDVVYYQLTQETSQFAKAYEMLPRKEIVVNKGDTLAGIAARTLGSATEWKAIWRQNDSIDNPDQLEAGAVLFYVDTAAMTASHNQPTDTQLAVHDIQFDINDGQVLTTNSAKTISDTLQSVFGNALAQLSALT